MKRKKVVFAHPQGLSDASMQNLLQAYAPNFDRSEFEIVFYSMDVGANQQRHDFLRKAGVDVRVYNDAVRFSESLYEEDFDILQTSIINELDPFYTSLGRPVVAFQYQYNKIIPELTKTLLLTQFAKKTWLANGGLESKCEIVGNPIICPDLEQVPSFRTQLGLNNKFIFCYEPSIDGQNYYPVVFNAYRKIHNENTALVLRVDDPNVINVLRNAGLSNIHSVSTKENIWSFYKTGDVYLYSTRKGGNVFDKKINRAIASGKPVIASGADNNDGTTAIIQSGFVHGVLNDFAAEMYNLYQNPKYTKWLAAKTKETYTLCHNPEMQVQKLKKVYRSLVV